MTDVRPSRTWRPRVTTTVTRGYEPAAEILDPTSLAAENAILRAEVARLSQIIERNLWRDTAVGVAQELLPKWRDGFTADQDDIVAIRRILDGPDYRPEEGDS